MADSFTQAELDDLLPSYDSSVVLVASQAALKALVGHFHVSRSRVAGGDRRRASYVNSS